MTDTNLDWKNLSFGYIRTDFNIRSYFRDGAWTKPELTSDETVTMHMAATALHYGQEAFEGQKAFRGRTGKSASSASTRTRNGCARRPTT